MSSGQRIRPNKGLHPHRSYYENVYKNEKEKKERH
jgi:hypothetical protein